MDKLFLSGLLGKTSSKREAGNEDDGQASSPRASRSTSQGPSSPNTLYSSSPCTTSGTTIAGMSAQYATARAPEQLLFDIATCDLVILVADEINYSRALPGHKDVLRSRNASGYFGRLLAEPASFPEYSDRAAGPGSEAAGVLASKPMIRRMHWPWQLASALLSFLYRDCCEVSWEGLPELRRLAEEVGARGLYEAVDYLLDPQHFLPWTVSDIRAAAVALKRTQLVEASDRYMSAMCATAVEESTRMATVMYHVRQTRPKFAISVSTPPSLPSIDGPAPLELPSLNSPTAAAAAARDALLQWSPSSRANAPPLTNSPSFYSRKNGIITFLSASTAQAGPISGSANGGNSFIATAKSDGGGGGISSSTSSCYRDSRLGVDIVDGVLRSVALDSKVLRGLLLPGRRRDNVLLCGGNGGGGHSGSGGHLARRSSSTALSNIVAVQQRASSPYSMAAFSRGGGAATAALAAAAALCGKNSAELPQVGSRLRSALNTYGGNSSPVGGGGLHGFPAQGILRNLMGGTSSQRSTMTSGVEEPSEASSSSSPLELMIIVPAVHLTASLAALMQRPLDSHVPGYMGPTLPSAYSNGSSGVNGLHTASGGGVPGLAGVNGLSGMGARKDAVWRESFATAHSNAHSSPLFDPFSKLSGIPGLTWGPDKVAMPVNTTQGSIGGTASFSSLLQQLPPASSLGDFDQFSLALALDVDACLTQRGSGFNGLTAATAAALSDGVFDFGAGNPNVPTVMTSAAVPGFTASRLLGSVLLTLAAADNAQYIVRADPIQAAHAVAFERRRAAASVSSLNSLAGALAAGSAFNGSSGGGSGGGPGGVSGAAPGISVTSSSSNSNNSITSVTACAGAANAAKAVLGPANPRDYFIPLSDHPVGAIAITLPVGLVLVDSATLEVVATSACSNGCGGSASVPVLGLRSRDLEYGLQGGYGYGGGPGIGSWFTSARVSALMPHLLASAAALSHVISAVGLISQILHVAGEQQGLFSTPALRACLRIFNPSTALLAVLVQTNTSFAVSAMENTIYIRKSPTDIVRLLQTLQSTLPVKNCASISSAASGCAAANTGGGGPSSTGSISGTLGGAEAISRARLGPSESFTGGINRQGNRQRSNRSLDIRTSIGYGNVPGVASPGPPPLLSHTSRRATTSELNLRPVLNNGTMPYVYGLPYSHLERLFPGWHLRVLELTPPGAMLEEF